MKIKLAIVLPMLHILACTVFFAQEKSGGDMEKWRIVYDDRDTWCPLAVGLSSDNSITVNGKEIRCELLFLFRSGVGELEGNYGHIEIKTGDMQIITSGTMRDPRTEKDVYKTIVSHPIITVYVDINWEGYKGMTAAFFESNTHSAVWREVTKSYFLQPAYIKKTADNGSTLRDFFDIKRSNDVKIWGNAFESFRSFLLHDNFRGRKIEFGLLCQTNIRGQWEKLHFKFTPINFPAKMHNELVQYIKRRGYPPDGVSFK